MLAIGFDAQVVDWVERGLGIDGLGPAAAIGVVLRGELIAGVVYNNYRPPNIEMTVYSTNPRWATKGHLRGLFQYPFRQLGCKRISAHTEAMNQPVRAFLCRLGFHEEGFHPDFYPSGDAVSFGLLLSQAGRWLAEDHSPC